MTDLAAEAAMVAEALGAEIGCDGELRILIPQDRDFATQGLWADGWFWPALVALVRRLRETERQRDELRDVVRGLEQALFLATSGRDHMTGGYRVAAEPPVPEPAYDPPERFDGTASVPVREGWDAPDWRQAQRDFA